MSRALLKSVASVSKRLYAQSLASFSESAKVKEQGVKAAVLKELGKPLVIEDIKIRKISKDQVKIKVRYCSVNQSDQQIIKDQHEYKPELPFIPGYEVAGKILEVGEEAAKKGFKVGDKVVGLNKESCGGFAEECILPVQDCFHAPTSISMKVASAILDGYTTAHLALCKRGRIEKGETVLITAAGGGVGLAAVDLAANVYSAKVIAVCSTEDKAALVREKGAFASLKYSDNIYKDVMKITMDKGVNLIMDATGGKVLEKAMACARHESRVVLASNAARNTPSVSPSLLLPNSVSLVGVSLWHYRKNDPEVYRSTIESVIEMADEELICPHVSKEFDLNEVNEALQYLEDAKCTGKVVLDLD